MEKEQTAFKHPNCGGVIMQVSSDQQVFFECDTCGEQADEIDSLILRGLVIIRRGKPTIKRGDETRADGPQTAEPSP